MLGVVHLLLMAAIFVFLRWRGVGFWGAVFSAAPATVFAFFTWKAAPIYKQHARLLSALEQLAPESDRAAIKDMLARNSFKFIEERDIRKYRDKSGVGFKIAYAGIIDVVPGVRLEVRFDQVVPSKAG